MNAHTLWRYLFGSSLLLMIPVASAAPWLSLSFGASPKSVNLGGQTQLNWYARNASSCSASGDWSGLLARWGSVTVGPLTSDSTFTLQCSNWGNSITRSVTVSVSTPATTSTVSLSALPTSVASSGYSTLTWSSNGVDNCTASGGWSGPVALSGNAPVGPLTEDATFSLNCTGSNGSAVAMVTVMIQSAVILWTMPSTNTDGSALTNLVGYRIYYGTASKSYDQSVTVTDASATQWTLSLGSGDWYFAVAALNSNGKESAYSNEVMKTIK